MRILTGLDGGVAKILVTEGVGEGAKFGDDAREQVVEVVAPPAHLVGDEGGEIGGGEGGAKVESLSGFGGARSDSRTGQIDDVIGQGGDLEGEGAGIRFVGEQKIEGGGPLGLGKVAPAIGHDAVGNFKDGFERAPAAGFDCKRGLDEGGNVGGAFEAATEFEETPAVAAGHVFHGHTGEGGDVENEDVEQFEALRNGNAAGARTSVKLKFAENAPGVGGEAVAQGESEAAEAFADFADGAKAVGLIDKSVNFAFDGGKRVAFTEFGGEKIKVGEEADQRGEIGRFFCANFGEAAEDAAEKADGILKPFGVAAEPVEVVGDAAGDFGGGTFEADDFRAG